MYTTYPLSSSKKYNTNATSRSWSYSPFCLTIKDSMKVLSKQHNKFGKRIKSLRKKKNMTQEDLAFEIGVDRSYMGFIERGERNLTLEKIAKIAKALSVSLSELFKGI